MESSGYPEFVHGVTQKAHLFSNGKGDLGYPLLVLHGIMVFGFHGSFDNMDDYTHIPPLTVLPSCLS